MDKIVCVVELTNSELVNINGGQMSKDTSFGQDVGYLLGWCLSALGKGASHIHG